MHRTEAQRATARVVLVTGSLQGGGAERVLSNMANYWAERGWSVTLATWSGPEAEDFYPLDERVQRAWLHETRPGGGRLRGHLRRVRRLRALLRAERPDAVLSFISTSNVLTLLAACGLRVRVVVSERIDPAADRTIRAGWKWLRNAAYLLADAIVVQNPDIARWVRRRCLRRAEVIPNALRPLPDLRVPREPLVVAVGRLAPQKGFDILLDAFARIAPRYDDWQLALIGDGAERDALVLQAADLGVAARVRFVGRVRDVESWMARAGLVVQPSRYEGFPNVLLEAMGMGAPVISSDCPSGPADIVRDGVNGRLVPVDDAPALAEAMAQLIDEPQLRARLGRAARQVRERFRPEAIMAQWERTLLA